MPSSHLRPRAKTGRFPLVFFFFLAEVFFFPDHCVLLSQLILHDLIKQYLVKFKFVNLRSVHLQINSIAPRLFCPNNIRSVLILSALNTFSSSMMTYQVSNPCKSRKVVAFVFGELQNLGCVPGATDFSLQSVQTELSALSDS